MKKTIFALFSICLIATSCKKDKSDPVNPIADKPYMNINAGTNWTYDVITDPGTGTQTTVIDTVTVTSTDTTINARVYKIVNHTNGNAKAYFNVTGSDYYEFRELAAAGAQVEQLYLKDNVALNGTWSQDVSINIPGVPVPVPIHIENTVMEKGNSKTVNGITYNDVIMVKTDLTSSLLPGGIVSDIRSYYTRNIGLIEGDYNIEVSAASIAIHSQTLLKTADPR
jgi:hypothetical protein